METNLEMRVVLQNAMRIRIPSIMERGERKRNMQVERREGSQRKSQKKTSKRKIIRYDEEKGEKKVDQE